MTSDTTLSHTGHLIAGAILCTVAGFVFVIGSISLAFPKYAFIAWIAAIPALFFGRAGLANFSAAEKLTRSKQTEIAENFVSFLLTGEQVQVILRLDLTTLGSRTRDFRLQVQRVLNEYFSALEKLPKQKYTTLDALLNSKLRARAAQFRIPNFEIQTIEVRLLDPVQKRAEGGFWMNQHE